MLSHISQRVQLRMGMPLQRRCLLVLSALALALLVCTAIPTLLYWCDDIRLGSRDSSSNMLPPNQPWGGARSCKCKKPDSLLEPERFHAIGSATTFDDKHCILAFSSYFDDRDGNVKIVADSDLGCHYPADIQCRLFYRDYDDCYVSSLTLSYITTTAPGETQRLGVVYSCDSHPDVSEIPYAVSFQEADSSDCGKDGSLLALPVGYNRSLQAMHKFSVCVPPLFGLIRPLQLVEFVEMHRLLGATRFTFYNESLPRRSAAVLDKYVKLGVAQVIQWHSRYPTEILYHNQQIMQADCMYRNLYQADYVAQVDIDEVLLPRSAPDWHVLIDRVEKKDTAVFMFLHRLFSLDERAQCREEVDEDELVATAELTSTYFKRLQYQTTNYGPTDRSKIIYRPHRLREVCTHHAVPLPRYETLVLDIGTASVNHYRRRIIASDDDTDTDREMCRRQDELQKRILEFEQEIIRA